MQEYPLDMVACGIRILHLIKGSNSAHPEVTQTWYSDDAWELVTFNNLVQYFDSLKQNVTARGS